MITMYNYNNLDFISVIKLRLRQSILHTNIGFQIKLYKNELNARTNKKNLEIQWKLFKTVLVDKYTFPL